MPDEEWCTEVVGRLREIRSYTGGADTTECALLTDALRGIATEQVDPALLKRYERTTAPELLPTTAVRSVLNGDVFDQLPRPDVRLRLGLGMLAAGAAAALVERTSPLPAVELVDPLQDVAAFSRQGLAEQISETSRRLHDRAALLKSAQETLLQSEQLTYAHPRSHQAVQTAVKKALAAADSSDIGRTSDAVERAAEGTWEPNDLLWFSGLEFEHLIGRLYEEFGYETIVTRGTHDYGIDVVASDSEERGLVQVKRYTEESISGPEMSEYVSLLVYFDADFVTVATSSDFTTPAYNRQAFAPNRIRLLDGQQIAALLSASSLVPPPTTAVD